MVSNCKSAGHSKGHLTGIALMCGALFCFACLDASAKWLNQHMEPMQTVFVRYSVSMVLVGILLNPAALGRHIQTTRPFLQVARSLMLLLATALNIIALQYLQLAQTMSIMFTTPLFVALLAGPMLGEWVGWRRLLVIAFGFLGILVVTRPGTGELHPYALLSVLGALCYALYNLATRFLAAHDASETTILYSGLVGTILLAPFMPFIWTMPAEPTTWFVMVLIGAFGAGGHWLLILAHRHAPAAVLAPYIFTQIVWMVGLGGLVFNEAPDVYTVTGAAIVILAGLYLFFLERRSATALRIK